MRENYLRKYFIMGSQDCDRNPVEVLEEALSAGITAFQYREKGIGAKTGEEKLALGKQLRKLCAEYNVPFIINDDVDLIEPLQADGIHVGQGDEKVEVLRQKFSDLIIGLSVSTREEFERSPISLVDYIGAGAVYRTTSKEDAKDPVGVEWIKYLRQAKPDLSIVGIGGITEENAKEVLDAGADGVAVISAITKSENIERTVKLL